MKLQVLNLIPEKYRRKFKLVTNTVNVEARRLSIHPDFYYQNSLFVNALGLFIFDDSKQDASYYVGEIRKEFEYLKENGCFPDLFDEAKEFFHGDQVAENLINFK